MDRFQVEELFLYSRPLVSNGDVKIIHSKDTEIVPNVSRRGHQDIFRGNRRRRRRRRFLFGLVVVDIFSTSRRYLCRGTILLCQITKGQGRFEINFVSRDLLLQTSTTTTTIIVFFQRSIGNDFCPNRRQRWSSTTRRIDVGNSSIDGIADRSRIVIARRCRWPFLFQRVPQVIAHGVLNGIVGIVRKGLSGRSNQFQGQDGQLRIQSVVGKGGNEIQQVTMTTTTTILSIKLNSRHRTYTEWDLGK
mmetsp:Transcript_9537/g.17069  ORF Transcript_9537/g.17069 Transcript_9537/m.17069 type:complete len:247 (-) Transcript_9537:479-1219(-)